MKKVLVTGANGLLGSHILKELLADTYYEVYGLIRTKSNNTLNQNIHDKVQWIYGDILDIIDLENAFEGMDVIIHTAALVSYDQKLAKSMMKINETGTANVCNTALLKGIKKLVYISSIATLGKIEGENSIDESAEWNQGTTHTPYALSKYKAEMQVWRSFYEGLPVSILNPSVILGSGRWDQTSLQIIPRLAKGGTIYPLGSTGFVDVSDVAVLTIKAIDGKYTGQRYIISGFNSTYKELFDLITAKLGVKKPFIPLYPWLANLLWRMEYIRSTIMGGNKLLTKQTAKTINTFKEYDNSKSIKAFDFTYKDKLETINQMVNAYKKKTERHN